jgi:hypothetical protein
LSEPSDASAPGGSLSAERPANLRCRSCGAAILWALTPAGRRVPLDAEPVEYEAPAGRYAVLWPADGGTPVAVHRPALYLTHFATCPNAASHRKPRETS